MSRSATAETADDEGASAIAATDSEPPRSNENPSLAATSADIDAQLPTLADDISAPQETATRESGENERAELPVAVLVIVNPVDSGGEIFYLVDGESFALRPGESHRLPAERERRIAFHRGDSFGDSETTLLAGRFEFRVTLQGWALVTSPIDADR